MRTRAKNRKVKTVPVWIGILVFILAFLCGVASKFAIKPSWAQEYSVQWSDELGTLKADIPYGDGEANKFDLYLPKDNTKENYGLVVYLHAGGFTTETRAATLKCFPGCAARAMLPVASTIRCEQRATTPASLHSPTRSRQPFPR